MSNFKNLVLIAIMTCAGLIPLVRVGNAGETSVQKQTSILELLRKARTKQTELIEPPSEVRIIHFPKDRSLGELMIAWENPQDSSIRFGGYPFEEISWERYGHAQGDIKVPKGKLVKLILDSWTWQNPENLSALKLLDSDDIYSLILSPRFSSGEIEPSDKCIPYLVHLTGLNALDLDGDNITSRGLEQLTTLKTLERFRSPTNLDDSGMVSIGKLRSLKVLHIFENNSITNEGLKQIANLKSLKILALSTTRTTDKGLNVLSSLPSLNLLILNGNFKSDAAIYLKDVPNLRTLRIDMAHFNDRGMENVSNLTKLENLDTHWVEHTTDRGITYLKNLPNLKQLDVAHAKLTDKAMLDLRQISRLESLYLPYPGITDEGLKHIAQLNNRLFKIICG